MAGLTSSTFSIKPLVSRPNATPSFAFCVYFQPMLFRFRFCYPSFSMPNSPSSSSSVSVAARWTGGSHFSSGDLRRNGKSNAVDDQVLDISSIRSDTVRLIDEQKNMVGVVPKREAIRMAAGAELDLVILSSNAVPPVVRIMDYDKYRYELQKKKRGQQKKNIANRMDLKVLKMGYNIDSHDYSVRLKFARKFLEDGDKVKVIVNLRGRENDFKNNAIELIRRFQRDVGELANEESKNLNDKNIYIVLAPNKVVPQTAPDPTKKKEPKVDEISTGI